MRCCRGFCESAKESWKGLKSKVLQGFFMFSSSGRVL